MLLVLHVVGITLCSLQILVSDYTDLITIDLKRLFAGTVYACGDNRSGQCGVGNLQPQILTPTRINYRGPPIVKVCIFILCVALYEEKLFFYLFIFRLVAVLNFQ